MSLIICHSFVTRTARHEAAAGRAEGAPYVSSRGAILTVCVPKDKSVWPASEIVRTFRDRALRVADPLQVLWDVRVRDDADSQQAANHLLESLRADHAKVNVA